MNPQGSFLTGALHQILISLALGVPGQDSGHLKSQTRSLLVINILSIHPACHANVPLCATTALPLPANARPSTAARVIHTKCQCSSLSVPCLLTTLQFKAENETCQSFLPLLNNKRNPKKLAWRGAVQHRVSVIDRHSDYHDGTGILFPRFDCTHGGVTHRVVKMASPVHSKPNTCPHIIAVTSRLKNGSYHILS